YDHSILEYNTFFLFKSFLFCNHLSRALFCNGLSKGQINNSQLVFVFYLIVPLNKALINLFDILSFSSDSFIDVDADFHARVPVVVCREKQSGLLCKVSAGNENACLTTNHLTALGKLESKLVPLVIAFRHWAKVGLFFKCINTCHMCISSML
uniref:Terminal uridylyltransferase 4/7 nucleotidyltransferase domain-containing protein n=1 Tax=Sus scrofa TaxID=9823 RepID=A0A8D1EZL1_PIG